MNLLFALQAPQATPPTLLDVVNLLLIFGIICSIAALVVSRRQVDDGRRIKGFEFLHESEPLSPQEPFEFYYLF